MKIFTLIIAFFVFVTLYYVTPIQAISPSLAPSTCRLTTVPALGVTCGNADDNCANSCCALEQQTQHTPLPGFVSDTLTLLHIRSPIDYLQTFQTSVATQPCMSGIPTTPGDLTNPACRCIKPTDTPLKELLVLCDNITSSDELAKCQACLNGTGQSVGIWTGVGCVRSNTASFIQETLLGWGIGFAGGISMLCIIYAAFMMQTSGGNAEKVKKAQQLMTSCITGLMIIIFSVLILQLIGAQILRIPGFS